MALEPNIEANERTTRYVLGAVLVIGAILGFGRFWAILFGLALIAEGYLGWCAIPILAAKFKKSPPSEPPVT